MVQRLTGGLCVLLAVAAAGIAWADDATVRKELLHQFDKSVAAWKRKDVKAFMTTFSPDYKGVGMNGQTQDFKGAEAEFAETIKSTKSLDAASMTIDKLTANGNLAEIDQTMKLKMTVVDTPGQMGPKGATHKMDIVGRSHEAWEKQGGQWKMKSTKTLPGGSLMVDGKAMGGPPSGGAPKK
jgi:hypothetical protein